MKLLVSGLIALLGIGAAHADPCEGKLPEKAGAVFTGSVRYITYCYTSRTPRNGVPLRASPDSGGSRAKAAWSALPSKRRT